jgi:nucleotide-binding universal stress UspA family protein
VPVLVVRAVAPFRTWLDEQRPLRVVLGADQSRSTDAAMRCIEDWQKLAPCDVTAVHLYWAPQEFSRLGLEGVRSLIDADPNVTSTLTRELARRLSPADRPDAVRVLVEPHLGRVGERLAEIACEREADLLVVGSHTRSALGRVLEGSVSRGAAHTARTSVLWVPAPRSPAEVRVPRLRRVLAATDFSPAGNAAVGMAYALCEPGGAVDLVHVTPRRDAGSVAARDIFALEQAGTADPRRAETHTALNALIPTDTHARVTRCYALESDDPAEAIAQAGARLEADAICVGRRGRSAVAEAVSGSVSRGVVTHADRAVLLAQAPRE